MTLENEILKIACEIASTNTVEYELQNIQKCLATGFDKVAVVSSDTKHLGNIQRQAKMLLTPEQLDKLHFLEPESFHLFLENISRMTSVNKSSGTQMTEQKVKGYKIRTEFKEPSTSTLPKQSLFDIIKGAFKRKGKKE